jgi:hypothetical protein
MGRLKMNNKELIKGKVAKILTSRDLVINKGSEDGIFVGMKFDVLDPKGENIIDPDSKEILGSVLRPKVRIEITSVQKRLSIGSTYKKETYNIGGSANFYLSDFARALRPPEWVTKYETLKTDEATWENLDEEESFVKTGDPVIEVIEIKEDVDEKKKTISTIETKNLKK